MEEASPAGILSAESAPGQNQSQATTMALEAEQSSRCCDLSRLTLSGGLSLQQAALLISHPSCLLASVLKIPVSTGHCPESSDVPPS